MNKKFNLFIFSVLLILILSSFNILSLKELGFAKECFAQSDNNGKLNEQVDYSDLSKNLNLELGAKEDFDICDNRDINIDEFKLKNCNTDYLILSNTDYSLIKDACLMLANDSADEIQKLETADYEKANSNNFEFANTDDSIKICFTFNGNEYLYNLNPRENAHKYFFDSDKINNAKLVLFLEELYKRNILPEYALEFCFDNFTEILDDLLNKINLEPENASLVAIKNTGNVSLKSAKNGIQIDKNNLILNIYYNLLNNLNSIDVPFYEIKPNINDEQVLNEKFLRGKFYTTYSSSTAERKHNIEKALAEFDGIKILPNEVLSFNKTTGVRSEENGYKGAKIIANGKFEDGVGGGVCQASTTLYNACLVAGLQIEEVNQHSLRVGYIAPSFDAMVNYGSSDLKIKNTTNSTITIATKCDGNICEVFVYGEKNPYKIVRRSEEIKEIEPKEDIIVSVENYDGNLVVGDGEEKYANYPKKGLISVGYLDYYQNDCLIATKKIRQNTYNASQGIKVVGRPITVSADMENIEPIIEKSE